MTDLDTMRAALVQESRELLAEMDNALLAIERDGPSEESIHAVFRAAHTIKGSAGLFGLDHVVGFTHALETILDEARAGRLDVGSDLVSLLIECGDHLNALMDGIESGAKPESVDPDGREDLLARLAAHAPKRSSARGLAAQAPLEPKVEVVEHDADAVDNDAWHISLRPAKDILQCGLDPLSILRYLGTMGKILQVEVIEDQLPGLSAMDPEQMHLGFEIRYASQVDRQRIEDAFEFLSEGSLMRIVPPHARVEDYLAHLSALPEGSTRLGELLVGCKALTPRELERVLLLQEEAGTAKPALGRILVAESIVPPAVVAAALQRQKKGREKAVHESRVLKVEAEKLDILIDLVGELVIASASAGIAARAEGARRCEESIANLTHLVESIRDSALGLRMVPIGEVFNRFPRVVRDLAKELGKSVEVEISGAETELDKSMVDKLSDPLTHIVRNSMDHGIESRSDRIAAGKRPEGTIRFHAYHETGSIVIEVSDDGGGIRRSRVLARAIERGLVAPGQELTDQEILMLIFEPGFSTADAVTNLSGRGVGMDVVKRNIESLRGEIEVESDEGAGAVIRLRMPLTLAIIDGFLVGVGNRSYVVPLDMVVECADHRHGTDFRAEEGLAHLRGEPLPLVRLRDVFDLPGSPPSRENILVVEYGARRAGLVVDSLQGEFQTVIKPLSQVFSGAPGVGGSTILGTGEVALILDVPALVHRLEKPAGRLHEDRHQTPVPAGAKP